LYRLNKTSNFIVYLFNQLKKTNKMTTPTVTKKKLTLNKRTIVLLNENDMKMMEGGTANPGGPNGDGSTSPRCNNYEVTKNPRDLKCNSNNTICPKE
jgi:hypothetical protein